MTRPRRPPAHRTGPRCQVLEHITRPNVKLAVWKRRVPDGLESALLDWARHRETGFDAPCRARAEDVASALQGLMEERWRAWLTEDLVQLLGLFQRLAGVTKCRLVFGVVRGDQCRKFHVDRLRLRMISTYAGPGTEWLPEAAVRRAALREPAACPELANRQIVRSARLVRHARAGDVLVMKGALATPEGVVHRSPPIESLGVTRVVAVATA